MPSPADARKVSTKKAAEKSDLAPQLARKRSQDFATKISGWNEAGGGICQKENEVIVLEDPEPKEHGRRDSEAIVEAAEAAEASFHDSADEDGPEATFPATPTTPSSGARLAPKSVGARKTAREVNADRKAWVRRKSKPQVEIAAEVKHAGTPKKRVVSDGHWRRDRQPKEESPAPEPEKDTTPKPIIIRRSVVAVGLKVPPSTQDFVETVETNPRRSRPTRSSRSRSRSRSNDGRHDAAGYESPGARVYMKRRKPSRSLHEELKAASDPRTSESSFTAPSSNDNIGSSTGITTPSPSLRKATLNRPVSEPRLLLGKPGSRENTLRPRTARPSAEAEDAPRRPVSAKWKPKADTSDDDERLRRNGPAGNRERKTPEPAKKHFSLPAAPIVTPVHGTRIQGWLAGMADPFTETRDPSLTPEPLEIKKAKSRKRLDVNEDESDGAGNQRRRSTRRRASRPELDRIDTVYQDARNSDDEGADSTPLARSGLKRSGARRSSRSPVKQDPASPDERAFMSGALPAPESRRVSAKPSGSRFPTTGKEIVSINDLPSRRPSLGWRPPSEASEQATVVLEGSVLSRASDGDSPRRHRSGLKRRGTKHSDLISVLSMTRDDSHAIAPARSQRARRARPETLSIQDLMNELSADELRYQRELRTLVDGVIPVLLQHALSGPDAAAGSRVFSRSLSDPAVTKPITDMGVALERMKTCHRRIPMHHAGDLLAWADSASRIYSDYLACWRLGFKNVVVNLAPADSAVHAQGWDQGLTRDKNGDLVNGHGEQVDVAYLLKRPLVRLKSMSKLFREINEVQPSADAEHMTARYHDLVQAAKQRVNDEHARLEDETAANIDSSRARDPRSLAPITGVAIDGTRCVRARDYFDMDLTHSSGQQLGCKIEIIYRDDAQGRGSAGDILFCEVSTSNRWLLFPPLPHSLVSARKGDRPNELIVMIRGFMSNAQQWREVMSIQADEDYTCSDWLQMLGSSPMPPRLSRKSSFNMLKSATFSALDQGHAKSADTHEVSREPSLREIEVPIGERAVSASRVWDASEVNSVSNEPTSTQKQRAKAKRYRSTPNIPAAREYPEVSKAHDPSQADSFYETPRHSKSSEFVSKRPMSGPARSESEWSASTDTAHRKDYSVWMPPSEKSSDESVDEDDRPSSRRDTRPGMHRRTSSVPSLDLPRIPKLRHTKNASTPRDASRQSSPERTQHSEAQEPRSAPAKLQKRRMTPPKERSGREAKAPAPPSHSRSTSLGLKSGILPSLTPAFLKKNRRPSSPLKHEYEPSTASDSLTDSDLSEFDGLDSVTSGSTVDDEAISTIGDLKAFREYTTRPVHQVPASPQSCFPGASLAPSESASQAPYRTVPPTNTAPARTVATIFCWSERGSWDSLHPQECSVFVSPGLIEAFDLAQAAAVSLVGDDECITPSAKGVKPLVALELTPLVPLRRGTAVDISIRSPPTPNSLIRTGNNIMFRSESPDECERLYALINRARIDNPTYLALQNARGPTQQSNWGEVMDRRNAARATSGSWWHLGSKRGSTYRSKGSRAASTAATDSSIGTMNTAFSALRRFSGGSRFFNIAKSTITSREGTRSSNSESLSSGAATPVPLDPRLGTPLGITNAKIRMYARESLTKWRDMGSARLTVMIPPRPDPNVPADPRTTGLEKRIMVFGKSKGEVMLDVTLGETAFERVARTGIAVSVWEESMGPNGEVGRVGAVGGVNPGRKTVYMVQMKSERDAAYTFGLVGKLRY